MLTARHDLHLPAVLHLHQRDLAHLHGAPRDLDPLKAVLGLYQPDLFAHVPHARMRQHGLKACLPVAAGRSPSQTHGSFSGDAEDFLSRTGSSGFPTHVRRPVVHADFRHAFQAGSRLGQHPRDHQRLTNRLQLQAAAYEAERQLPKREADERGFGRGDFHNPHFLFPGDAFSGERQTREEPGLGLGLGLGLGPGRCLGLGLGLGPGSVDPSRPVPSLQTLHRLRRRLSWEEGPDVKTWPRGGPDSPFAAFRRQVLQDARAGREGVQSLSGTAPPPPPPPPAPPLPLPRPPSPLSGMRKRPSQAQRCSKESRRRREDFNPSLLLLHRRHSQRDRDPQWDVGEEDEVNNVSVNVNVSVAASHETRAKNEADNNDSFSQTSHAGPHSSKFLSVSRQPLSQAPETASSNPAPTTAAAATAPAGAGAGGQSLFVPSSLTSSEEPADVSDAPRRQGADKPATRGFGGQGKTKHGPKRREKLQLGISARNRGAGSGQGPGCRPSVASTPSALRKMKLKLRDTRRAQATAAGEPVAASKAFRCSQCRYRTDRKNNLKRHVVTMHQKSPRVLECCGALFHSKAALRDHVTLFHRGGYRCQVCGRNFCRKALLRRHLTVHSGQKDFSCRLCGYATSHKSNLERHQRVHARKSSAAPVVPGFLLSQHPHIPTSSSSSAAAAAAAAEGGGGGAAAAAFENEENNNSTKTSIVSFSDDISRGGSSPWMEMGMGMGEPPQQKEEGQHPGLRGSPLSWQDRSSSSRDSSDCSWNSSEDPRRASASPRDGPSRLFHPDFSPSGDSAQRDCGTVSPFESFKSPRYGVGGDPLRPAQHGALSRKLCFPNRLRETYPSSSKTSDGDDDEGGGDGGGGGGGGGEGEGGDRAPGSLTASAETRTKKDDALLTPCEPADVERERLHVRDVDDPFIEEAKENENPLRSTHCSVKKSSTSEHVAERASTDQGADFQNAQGDSENAPDDSENVQLQSSQRNRGLQSKLRMCCRPYRCFGCGESFAHQGVLCGHVCKAEVGGILNFSLISSVLKGCIRLSASEGDVTP